MKKRKKELDGRFVLPGDKLIDKSDFKAGEGVFIEKDSIYASLPGKVRIKNNELSVKQSKKSKTIPPREGEFVIGRVYSVRRVFASINLYYVFREEELYPLEKEYKGSIYIGDLGPYVDETSDAIRRSDIVIGKVSIDRRTPLSISFEGRDEFGCVAARCEECGIPMKKKGKKLYCEECEEYRDRIVSTLYNFDAFNNAVLLIEEEEEE